jgi:hypothetical protein
MTVTSELIKKCKHVIISFLQEFNYVFDRLGTDIHHEIKEAYNITSSKSVFPSEDSNPEFRSSVTDLALKLSELTRRLLACMALALGKIFG